MSPKREMKEAEPEPQKISGLIWTQVTVQKTESGSNLEEKG